MHVIRLDNGDLRVPRSVLSEPDDAATGPGAGGIIAHAYVDIGPDDPDYDRLAGEAISQAEADERRRHWRDEAADAELQRLFTEYKAHRDAGE